MFHFPCFHPQVSASLSPLVKCRAFSGSPEQFSVILSLGPLHCVQLLVIRSLSLSQSCDFGVNVRDFFSIKPTSLFKLLASWWQLFNFLKTLIGFLKPFARCLTYSSHSVKCWVSDWVSKSIFPVFLLLAYLFSLSGSQLCEIRSLRSTVFLILVAITVHKMPSQSVFAEHTVVLHPSQHSTAALLSVFRSDVLKSLF